MWCRWEGSISSVYLPLSPASPPPQVMEAHQAKLRFFKASTCQQLLERLVGHFMLLSEEVPSQCGDFKMVDCGFSLQESMSDVFVSFICRSCRTGKQIRRILVSLSVCHPLASFPVQAGPGNKASHPSVCHGWGESSLLIV